MALSGTEKPKSLAEAIDVIESTYELMLAYAAQGRQREQEDPLGVRQALRNTDAALDVFDAATPSDLGVAGAAAEKPAAEMLAVLKADVAKARAAFRFVLAHRSISSQMIDNLNASIHVRALLTDLFLIDEAIGGEQN